MKKKRTDLIDSNVSTNYLVDLGSTNGRRNTTPRLGADEHVISYQIGNGEVVND